MVWPGDDKWSKYLLYIIIAALSLILCSVGIILTWFFLNHHKFIEYDGISHHEWVKWVGLAGVAFCSILLTLLIIIIAKSEDDQEVFIWGWKQTDSGSNMQVNYYRLNY